MSREEWGSRPPDRSYPILSAGFFFPPPASTLFISSTTLFEVINSRCWRLYQAEAMADGFVHHVFSSAMSCNVFSLRDGCFGHQFVIYLSFSCRFYNVYSSCGNGLYKPDA